MILADHSSLRLATAATDHGESWVARVMTT